MNLGQVLKLIQHITGNDRQSMRAALSHLATNAESEAIRMSLHRMELGIAGSCRGPAETEGLTAEPCPCPAALNTPLPPTPPPSPTLTRRPAPPIVVPTEQEIEKQLDSPKLERLLDPEKPGDKPDDDAPGDDVPEEAVEGVVIPEATKEYSKITPKLSSYRRDYDPESKEAILGKDLEYFLATLPKHESTSNWFRMWQSKGDRPRMYIGQQHLTQGDLLKAKDGQSLLYQGVYIPTNPRIRYFLQDPSPRKKADFLTQEDAQILLDFYNKTDKAGRLSKNRAPNSKSTEKTLEKLQKRRDSTKSNVSLPLSIMGSGETKHKPMTATDGKLGTVQIDMQKLMNKLELEAHPIVGGKAVLKRKHVHPDLINLITKRGNSKQKYSAGAIELYKELIEKAGLSDNAKRSRKGGMLIVNNPEAAIDRLEVLMGNQRGGNNSNRLKNEISNIADYLLKERVMTKEEHRHLHATQRY